jgi:hypothetical protein
MSNISKHYEEICHTLPGYRIWMDGEYEPLSDQEFKELKKKYD